MCNEEFKFTHHPIMDELMIEPVAAALLYTTLIMEELIDKGMVSGPKILTASGKDMVEKMKAAGYEPSTKEIEMCTAYLAQGLGGEEDA